METKEELKRQPTPTSNAMDVFEMQTKSQPTQSSQPQDLDPFGMDPPSKAPQPRDIFDDDLLGGKSSQKNQDPFDLDPQPVKKSTPQNNQDDLDIFFGTSSNQPATQNKPVNVDLQNRPSNLPHANRNDVSGFTVYNQLNTSNMKDMSAMGINNFLDINQDNKKDENETPKFDLREEPSGTIFDNNEPNKAQQYVYNFF